MLFLCFCDVMETDRMKWCTTYMAELNQADLEEKIAAKCPIWHSHHLCSHYLSVPWPFTPDFHKSSLSGSFWIAFTDLNLYQTKLELAFVCFRFFFILLFLATWWSHSAFESTLNSSIVSYCTVFNWLYHTWWKLITGKWTNNGNNITSDSGQYTSLMIWYDMNIFWPSASNADDPLYCSGENI